MDWTITQVIGHNVRTKRDALGMTAAVLGERLGEIFGKPWPRQTIYMMESGDRAMVAHEVLAVSHVLEIPLAQLFLPPADVRTVTTGTLAIPAESLASDLSASSDEQMQRIARSVRALDKSQRALQGMVSAQYVLVSDAKQAVLNQPSVQIEGHDDILSVLSNFNIQRASEYYEPETEELPESGLLGRLQGAEENQDGGS
ncbi:helix-turn-helix domain-containing protein [Arthrobacter sp. BPSS-3]|uniref:helix-turn-helix domain-containing protein n=1 Tax=Arthrobacter sp. BPSS-3 TaxID=3366580 RepID=UPI0037DCE3FB